MVCRPSAASGITRHGRATITALHCSVQHGLHHLPPNLLVQTPSAPVSVGNGGGAPPKAVCSREQRTEPGIVLATVLAVTILECLVVIIVIIVTAAAAEGAAAIAIAIAAIPATPTR
jgi:hypothetical protein